MGGGGEGGKKDRSNGAGAGDDLQGNFVVGVVKWDKELGGDRIFAKSAGGIPLLGIHKDCGDGGVAYDKRIVGVPPGG